jgi:hypothetical protein
LPSAGSIPYNASMEKETLEALRQASEKYDIRINSVFMAALRDCLRRRGHEIEIYARRRISTSAFAGVTFRQ